MACGQGPLAHLTLMALLGSGVAWLPACCQARGQSQVPLTHRQPREPGGGESRGSRGPPAGVLLQALHTLTQGSCYPPGFPHDPHRLAMGGPTSKLWSLLGHCAWAVLGPQEAPLGMSSEGGDPGRVPLTPAQD